mmetsp:Transcript_41175/g.82518  ORF Transcript_41175/g.82518 Transcript_41175/m.82518 type:complete len:90 (+) Transcript_41175:446-715(+)
MITVGTVHHHASSTSMRGAVTEYKLVNAPARCVVAPSLSLSDHLLYLAVAVFCPRAALLTSQLEVDWLSLVRAIGYGLGTLATDGRVLI